MFSFDQVDPVEVKNQFSNMSSYPSQYLCIPLGETADLSEV